MKKIATTINFYLSTDKMKLLDNYTIIELDNEGIENFKIENAIYSIEIIKKRFQKGYKLYTLLDNEIPVSFAWAKQSNQHFIGELNKTIVFEKKMNCIIDCITLPDARSKGYYSSLISYISNENKIFSTFIYTHNTNIPSQKGIEKAGFKKRFAITKFLFWYFKKENTGVKYKLV